MRIATYNIHAGRDARGLPSLDHIATTVRDGAFDVVLLQEVDRYLPRSSFADQARVLARRLGMYYRFYGRLRFGAAAFGNAVLSKEPPGKTIRLPLPSNGGEPRGAIGVTLPDVNIWSVHLGLREDWRATQLWALAATVERGPAAALVGGDFNAGIDSPEVIEFLERTGMHPLSTEDLTFPSDIPAHRIDFLFGRGFSPAAAGTIADPGSDHCLVWAAVTLNQVKLESPPVLTSPRSE